MSVSLENFANFAQTTLNGGISAGASAIIVSNATVFPTTGQYKLVIDNEVFVAKPPSGNTISVTGAQEGSAAANHLNGATVSLYITRDNLLSLHRNRYGFRNYLQDNPAALGAFLDNTTPAQQGLLNAQLYGDNFKTSHSLNDQLQRNSILYEFPYNNVIGINCPLIIPEFVRVICDCAIERGNGSGGTVTANYNGDTTSKALVNLYQPVVIVPVNGHIERMQVYCNPDGVNIGSGLFAGKTWQASGVTLISGGSGYLAGQILDLAQPSKAPYYGTQVTIDTVNPSTGAILTYHMSRGGIYSLPDKLQQLQWTQANGYTGTMALNGAVTPGVSGQVFDPTQLGMGIPAYLTQAESGSGTGALFTQQWQPDWSPGNVKYFGGNGVIGSTRLGDLYISSVGKSAVPLTGDPTYGFKFGFWCWGLNFDVGHVVINGGDIGVYASSSIDFRADALNPVGAARSMVMENCASYECPNVVLDTPDSQYFSMDNCQGVFLPLIRCFHNSSASNVINPAIAIGANTAISNSGAQNVGNNLKFMLQNGGSTTGGTAMSFDYSKSTRIELHVTNYDNHGTPAAYPVSKFVTFGSHIDPSCEITGSIDWGGQFPPTTGGSSPSAIPSGTYNANGTPIPIYGGTMPNCKVSIRNADVVGIGVPGILDESGNYTIKLSAPPTTRELAAEYDLHQYQSLCGQPARLVLRYGGSE